MSAGAPGRRVRPPAVAGSFYPADPDELRHALESALAGARHGPAPFEPRALVVPHAGYGYSGPVAASAYRLLAARPPERVALFGPSHFVPLRGLALPEAEALATPLGELPVDLEAARRICEAAPCLRDDAPHAREHSLEVQLPFLQHLLGEVRVLPVAVGLAPPETVARAMELAFREGLLVVVSTDLSHYLDYAAAVRRDRATAEAVLALRPQDVRDEDACGASALRGLLHAARRQGLRARLLDLRSSGDTAGPRDRVVGYGAFALG